MDHAVNRGQLAALCEDAGLSRVVVYLPGRVRLTLWPAGGMEVEAHQPGIGWVVADSDESVEGPALQAAVALLAFQVALLGASTHV